MNITDSKGNGTAFDLDWRREYSQDARQDAIECLLYDIEKRFGDGSVNAPGIVIFPTPWQEFKKEWIGK